MLFDVNFFAVKIVQVKRNKKTYYLFHRLPQSSRLFRRKDIQLLKNTICYMKTFV